MAHSLSPPFLLRFSQFKTKMGIFTARKTGPEKTAHQSEVTQKSAGLVTEGRAKGSLDPARAGRMWGSGTKESASP